MKSTNTTKGYSLVETLIAVSILLLSIVGPMTIAAKGIQTGIFVSDQTTAVFLAQEQIESVMAVRNQEALKELGTDGVWDWTTSGALSHCFGSGGCNIIWNNDGDPYYNVQQCNAGNSNCQLYLDTAAERAKFTTTNSGVQTKYRRVLQLQQLGGREVVASSTVSWSSSLFGGQRSVTLRSSFFNIYDFSD